MRAVERVRELGRVGAHAHADAAAAGGRLQHDGIPDVGRGLRRVVDRWSTMALPGQHRHAGGLRLRASGVLRAEDAQLLRGRSDEREPGGLDLLGEVGALGEEAVAGMDRLRAAFERGA